MTTIRCIDFETTGIPTDADPDHAIVEIGMCDVNAIVGLPAVLSETVSVLCDPGRPIPHEAMAVHHITDDMVAGATGSIDVLGSPDYFAAHNADYEQKFFGTGRPFICTWKVALRLWPEASSHGLQFLRYHLGLAPRPEECVPPHRAGPDAYLCAVLMERILEDGRASLDDMVRWSSGPALLPRITFGKHKGSKWEDAPTDYLDWIVNKSDMDRDVKANAKHHLKARSA
jgi:exodeoxyribonuclease X